MHSSKLNVLWKLHMILKIEANQHKMTAAILTKSLGSSPKQGIQANHLLEEGKAPKVPNSQIMPQNNFRQY